MWASYIPPDWLERLQAFANWDWFDCQDGGIINLTEIQRLLGQAEEIDGMVACHGAPRVDAEMLDQAPNLKCQHLG